MYNEIVDNFEQRGFVVQTEIKRLKVLFRLADAQEKQQVLKVKNIESTE